MGVSHRLPQAAQIAGTGGRIGPAAQVRQRSRARGKRRFCQPAGPDRVQVTKSHAQRQRHVLGGQGIGLPLQGHLPLGMGQDDQGKEPSHDRVLSKRPRWPQQAHRDVVLRQRLHHGKAHHLAHIGRHNSHIAKSSAPLSSRHDASRHPADHAHPIALPALLHDGLANGALGEAALGRRARGIQAQRPLEPIGECQRVRDA